MSEVLRARVHRAARAQARCDADLSEELAQEAFLALLVARPARVVDVNRWLDAVVRHSLIARRLRERRAPRVLPLEANDVIGGEDPSEVAERREEAARCQRCVSKLPPIYRDVIRLRYFEGRGPREAARVLEVPVETVKARLRRALLLLRRQRTDGPGQE